jgi:hypothetical protein
MKQQTAVEWFREKVFFKGSYTGEELRQLFNEALAMEKQQIIDAYNDGQENHVKFKFKSAERYWDELLKSEYEKHQEAKKGCTGPK